MKPWWMAAWLIALTLGSSQAANRFRAWITFEPGRQYRSAEIDFQKLLPHGTFDPHTVEVVAKDRVPHRIDNFFGLTKVKLNFVVPDTNCTNVAVYFDTLESGRGRRARYPGLLGDGDKFCEGFKRREIAASHFDCFTDFDGDGDLDLFKGGVEPFVYCFENVGRNRLIDRGRLTSGGELFRLPCSRANRSWVTVAFYDFDGDGDQDFFPSFGDGPDAGKIVFYRQTAPLTFPRVGPLEVAQGTQAGGWFPSITFVKDWDRDGVGPDALVGSNHRCWLYRNTGTSADGVPKFADAIDLGIELVNPRFDVADVDGSGTWDLFAGTQPGAVHWFANGTKEGRVVAWDGKYLIGDAHSGVKVIDFDGDGLLDVVSGRFWERTDLNRPRARRDYGGFWKNVGSRTLPRFQRRARGGPFTVQFQICDGVRQNSVRGVDWDDDGRLDLLAGDTDGFIWFFRQLPAGVFAEVERLRANVTASGGHARLDVCDWNNDGRKDLVVADGAGTVTLFLNRAAVGERLAPIQLGGRASVLVCDWDRDGRKDLVLADDKGYYFSRNTGTDAAPLLATPKPILFGGKIVSYVRPNLGSFVDWDGDGRRDLIGCHFENSIRFYRNIGSGAEPEFADPEGVTILQAESPQMISGADVLDWNGDGDFDLLTGQGHGGSGLRFYERTWLDEQRHQP